MFPKSLRTRCGFIIAASVLLLGQFAGPAHAQDVAGPSKPVSIRVYGHTFRIDRAYFAHPPLRNGTGLRRLDLWAMLPEWRAPNKEERRTFSDATAGPPTGDLPSALRIRLDAPVGLVKLGDFSGPVMLGVGPMAWRSPTRDTSDLWYAPAGLDFEYFSERDGEVTRLTIMCEFKRANNTKPCHLDTDWGDFRLSVSFDRPHVRIWREIRYRTIDLFARTLQAVPTAEERTRLSNLYSREDGDRKEPLLASIGGIRLVFPPRYPVYVSGDGLNMDYFEVSLVHQGGTLMPDLDARRRHRQLPGAVKLRVTDISEPTRLIMLRARAWLTTRNLTLERRSTNATTGEQRVGARTGDANHNNLHEILMTLARDGLPIHLIICEQGHAGHVCRDTFTWRNVLAELVYSGLDENTRDALRRDALLLLDTLAQ